MKLKRKNASHCRSIQNCSERSNATKRVSIGELNDLIMDAVRINEPPSYNGRRLRFYYSTQASGTPPTFVFFVNDENLLHFSYERYLENTIRTAYDFTGTPIRLILRQKKGEEE